MPYSTTSILILYYLQKIYTASFTLKCSLLLYQADSVKPYTLQLPIIPEDCLCLKSKKRVYTQWWYCCWLIYALRGYFYFLVILNFMDWTYSIISWASSSAYWWTGILDLIFHAYVTFHPIIVICHLKYPFYVIRFFLSARSICIGWLWRST